MMTMLYVRLQNLIKRREGQGMTEYAIIIGLIALACVLVIGGLGTQIKTLFQNITGQIPTAP